MVFENGHPNGNLGKKLKSLQAGEKSVFAIILSDDALGSQGFQKGERLEIEIGDAPPGSLAAVLQTDGHWFVGYLQHADGGVILADSSGQVFFPAEFIMARGRVFHARQHDNGGIITHTWSIPIEPFTVPCNSVMTWQTDANGVVTHADPLCCQFLGVTEEQLRAGAWKNRIHPEDREPYLRSRERALSEKVIYRNSVRILDAQEEYRAVDVLLVPIRGDGGLITGWHAVAELDEGRYRQSA